MISRILLAIGLLAVASSSKAAIVITEVMSDSANPSGSTANDDWFELTNTGPISISLVGWSWDDDSALAGTANFGSITSIGAGESIIITGEANDAGNDAAWRADWGISSGVQVATLTNGGFPGLGKGGDAVYIFDNTNTQVTFVTFGTATTGSSFEWDTAGNSLGVSVIGENGAFKAVSNGAIPPASPGPGVDIGSPGVAVAPVPEPRVVALLTAGVGLILYGFRRRRARG